jgi:hypothetical protein
MRGVISLCKHPAIHFLASGPIFKPSLVVVRSVPASESLKTKNENHWQFQRQCCLHLLRHPPLPLQLLHPHPAFLFPLLLSTCQKHIREQQLQWNDKRNSNPKFLQCFQMLRTSCCNFDEIECATVPRVFLHPCRDGRRSVFNVAFAADKCRRPFFATRRSRAQVNGWALEENVEPLMKHLDGMRCFHHHAIINPECMKNCHSQSDQSRNRGCLSLFSKECFKFGKVLLSQMQDDVREKQWEREGNQSIKVAAAATCRDTGTKKAFFDACTGSALPVSVLKSLTARMAMKTFHARAGASMDSWKRKNTARDVKGSSDASFRADQKSKVSQATKKAGEFQMRKRGAGSMVTPTVAGAKTAKKPTPKSKQAEDKTEVEEEGRKGGLLMMMVRMPLLWHANVRK